MALHFPLSSAMSSSRLEYLQRGTLSQGHVKMSLGHRSASVRNGGVSANRMLCVGDVDSIGVDSRDDYSPG